MVLGCCGDQVKKVVKLGESGETGGEIWCGFFQRHWVF
jgi:hypothetical protein